MGREEEILEARKVMLPAGPIPRSYSETEKTKKDCAWALDSLWVLGKGF